MSSPRRGGSWSIVTRWLVVAMAGLAVVACGTLGAARPGSPASVSQPGEPVAEPSTFHSLGIRWPVRGDANGDAVIGVQYRRRGDEAWLTALSLFRTNPAAVSPENRVARGWLFAGSIVDLTPDTEYEVALSLIDPDGGGTQRVLLMRTAAEPREPAGMRLRHVVPAGPDSGGPGTGTTDDPFRGLRAAQASAMPGDLFLLHAGTYAEGTWTIDRHGTAERPIIYRGAGDGEAILDGGGRERLVSAPGVQHVWLERLSLRNARYLFVGHSGSSFVVRRCRLEVVWTGITAINGGYTTSRGFVITDNVFVGPAGWPRRRGIEDVNGVVITGAGHVVAYNRMSNLGDGIHGTGYGRLSASDFHNNDVEASTDDGIEGDHADTNVRIFRNRITNAFSGISAQPSRGGPLYIFRNVIYNVGYTPFKLHNDTSGVLIFHNTSLNDRTPWDIEPGGETVNEVATRNNLFVGAAGVALRSTGAMNRCDFDRDGFVRAPGPAGFSVFAEWNGRRYGTPEEAARSGQLYRQHGAMMIDARELFANGLRAPDDADVRYAAGTIDPRLAPGSRAVDAAVVLPNFNDGFTGRAPDLGCCEIGQPLPHYGPRP